MNPQPLPCRVDEAMIQQAHQLYCQLTGQTLSLGHDRLRLWYELLRLGFSLADVRRVVRYLQREILADRRNVGALKLSNLLQPDRFEEDLNVSRIRLEPPPKPLPLQPRPSPPPEDLERKRLEFVEQLRELRKKL